MIGYGVPGVPTGCDWPVATLPQYPEPSYFYKLRGLFGQIPDCPARAITGHPHPIRQVARGCGYQMEETEDRVVG